MSEVEKYHADIVAFLENEFYWVDEIGKIRLLKLFDHQKTLLHAVFPPGDGGRSPYQNVVWSEPKKGGKTAIAAGVCLWRAHRYPDREIYCIANDLEQAESRVFRAVKRSCHYNKRLKYKSWKKPPTIEFSNGSFIQALSTNYAAQAGANPDFSTFTELWAYTLEGSRRLYAEMTPPPTIKTAMRWIETYAGYEDESDLLLEQYERVWKKDGRGRYVGGVDAKLDGLEVRTDGKFFCYWSHIPRMPWQQGDDGEAYYAEQKKSLRTNEYLRLHENRWVSSKSDFVTEEDIKAIKDKKLKMQVEGTPHVAYAAAVDLGTRHDRAALAVLFKNKEGKVQLAHHRVWEPRFGINIRGKNEVDLADVDDYLRGLDKRFHFSRMFCDPWEMAYLYQRWEGRIEEFGNSQSNQDKMAKLLLSLIKQRDLVIYPCMELEEEFKALHLKVKPDGTIRFDHSERGHDDLSVAVAMAAIAAADFWPAGVDVMNPEDPRLTKVEGEIHPLPDDKEVSMLERVF